MKKKVVEVLQKTTTGLIEEHMIEVPTYAHLGDYSLPCFPFAKKLKKSPNNIAQEIAASIQDPSIEKAEAVNGYVNIFMNRRLFADSILTTIQQQSEKYGSSNLGDGGVVTIDMSSPNIAKPFSMGHLRSLSLETLLLYCSKKVDFNR